MKFEWNRFRKYVLIIGLISITIGFIFLIPESIIPNIYSQTTSITFKSRDNLDITGIFYRPLDYNSSKEYPAVVVVHGINSNAEHMSHISVELTRRNFLVLAINMRGHHFSQGYCTLSANEPNDVMGAIDWLVARPDVNSSAIGVIGHSLGGMTVIKTSALDSRINATVALGAPPSVEMLLERYTRNLNFALLQMIINLRSDVSNPAELDERAPVKYVNTSHPRNLLLCWGFEDKTSDLNDQKLFLYNATGNSTALENVFYGNFTNGTAKMLKTYLTINHDQEVRHPPLIVDVISWMENALLGAVQGSISESDLIFWIPTEIGSTFLTLGFFMTTIAVFSHVIDFFIEKYKRKNKISDENKQVIEYSKRNRISTIIGCAGLFSLGGSLAVPLILTFNIMNVNFYRIPGVLVNLFLIQSIIIGAGLLCIVALQRKFTEINFFRMRINRSLIMYSSIIGLLISIYFVFGFFYLPNLPLFIFDVPARLFDAIILFILLSISFLIMEIFFRHFIFDKIFRQKTEIRNWIQFLGIGAICGLIQGLSLSLMLLPFLPGVLVIDQFIISLPLLGFLAGFLLFTLFGTLNNYLYYRTNSVIPSALFQAAILISFLIFRFVPF